MSTTAGPPASAAPSCAKCGSSPAPLSPARTPRWFWLCERCWGHLSRDEEALREIVSSPSPTAVPGSQGGLPVPPRARSRRKGPKSGRGSSSLSSSSSPSSLVQQRSSGERGEGARKAADEPENRDATAEEAEVDALLRLAAEGRLEPVSVELRLPRDADPAMGVVAGFFVRVRGVRLWKGDRRSVPFASGWVARHLGLPKRTVHEALRRLAAAGVLVHVDTLPGGGGKRGTWLWAPAPLQEGAVPVEAGAGVVWEVGEPEAEVVDVPLVGGAERAVVHGSARAAGHRAGAVAHGVLVHGKNGTERSVR
jgi:hypothetical protein